MEQFMEKQGRETFMVTILSTQNATWQGEVSWMGGKKTEYFRSALELIRLMDSVLKRETEGGDGEEDPT